MSIHRYSLKVECENREQYASDRQIIETTRLHQRGTEPFDRNPGREIMNSDCTHGFEEKKKWLELRCAASGMLLQYYSKPSSHKLRDTDEPYAIRAMELLGVNPGDNSWELDDRVESDLDSFLHDPACGQTACENITQEIKELETILLALIYLNCNWGYFNHNCMSAGEMVEEVLHIP